MAIDLAGNTVLVVDDESFSRGTVARFLEELGNPNVIHAEDGKDAIEALDSDDVSVDLIISDFNMPNVHGLDLLKSIRTGRCKVARFIPFAMLTGYADKHLVDMALGLDANAFLIKPISRDGLETRLKKMFRLVQSDNWLKSEDEYQEMDVSSALDDIVGVTSPAVNPPTARGIFVMRKDKPLFRNPMNSGVFTDEDLRAHQLEDEALGLDDSKPVSTQRAKQLDGYRCPLEQVKPGSTLARDVHTADGRLFMHAGSHISERVISILNDLQDLGHPVDAIWLVREK